MPPFLTDSLFSDIAKLVVFCYRTSVHSVEDRYLRYKSKLRLDFGFSGYGTPHCVRVLLRPPSRIMVEIGRQRDGWTDGMIEYDRGELCSVRWTGWIFMYGIVWIGLGFNLFRFSLSSESVVNVF